MTDFMTTSKINHRKRTFIPIAVLTLLLLLSVVQLNFAQGRKESKIRRMGRDIHAKLERTQANSEQIR
ncbi:unnamed protein product [Amoebophrya sp. A120]|nr:unnamed protein product [Amoebophrya sp. A120]|eukprot:GSA120T00018717001.1